MQARSKWQRPQARQNQNTAGKKRCGPTGKEAERTGSSPLPALLAGAAFAALAVGGVLFVRHQQKHKADDAGPARLRTLESVCSDLGVTLSAQQLHELADAVPSCEREAVLTCLHERGLVGAVGGVPPIAQDVEARRESLEAAAVRAEQERLIAEVAAKLASMRDAHVLAPQAAARSLAEAEVELAWARDAVQAAEHSVEQAQASRDEVATERAAMHVVVQQAGADRLPAAEYARTLLDEQLERLGKLHALRMTELRFSQARAADAQALRDRLASEQENSSSRLAAVVVDSTVGGDESGSGAAISALEALQPEPQFVDTDTHLAVDDAIPPLREPAPTDNDGGEDSATVNTVVDDMMEALCAADVATAVTSPRAEPPAVRVLLSVRGDRALVSVVQQSGHHHIPAMSLDGGASTPRLSVLATRDSTDMLAVPPDLLAEASAVSRSIAEQRMVPQRPAMPSLLSKAALPGTVFKPSLRRAATPSASIEQMNLQSTAVRTAPELQDRRLKASLKHQPLKAALPAAMPLKRARSNATTASESNKNAVTIALTERRAVASSSVGAQAAGGKSTLQRKTTVQEPTQPEVAISASAETDAAAQDLQPPSADRGITEEAAPVPAAEPVQPSSAEPSPPPQSPELLPNTEEAASPAPQEAPIHVVSIVTHMSPVAAELMALVRGNSAGATSGHASAAAKTAADELRRATRNLLSPSSGVAAAAGHSPVGPVFEVPSSRAATPHAASAADELRSMSRMLINSRAHPVNLAGIQSSTVASAANDLLRAAMVATTTHRVVPVTEVTSGQNASMEAAAPHLDVGGPDLSAQQQPFPPRAPSPPRAEASRAASESAASTRQHKREVEDAKKRAERERTEAAQRKREAEDARRRAERERAEAAAAQSRAAAEERRRAEEAARKQAEQQRAAEQAKIRAAAEERRQSMEAAKRKRAEEAAAKAKAIAEEQRRIAEAARQQVERERAEAAAARHRALAEERKRAEEAARRQAEQQHLEAEAAMARGLAERQRIATEAAKKRRADEEAAKARRVAEEQRRAAEEAKLKADIARQEAAAAKAKALAEEQRRAQQEAAQRLAELDAKARALADERHRVVEQKRAASSRQQALKKHVASVHREEMAQQRAAANVSGAGAATGAVLSQPAPLVAPTERIIARAPLDTHHDSVDYYAAAAAPAARAAPSQAPSAKPKSVAAEPSFESAPVKKPKIIEMDDEPHTDWYFVRR